MRLFEAGGLFDAQHGIGSREQLLLALTAGQIDEAVRRGHLIPEYRGVYRAFGAPRTPASLAMAALLAAGPRARLTGPFVLGAHDVDGFDRDRPFEVLAPHGHRPKGFDIRVRQDPLPDVSGVDVDGLRLAPVELALIESGHRRFGLDGRTLRQGFDSARWRGLVSTQSFTTIMDELGRRHPGVSRWRRMFTDVGPEPESAGERRLLRMLADVRPQPEAQVWLLPNVRVDLYWRTYRVALGYQGGVDHEGAEARTRDTERMSRLAAIGVLWVPLTARDLDAGPETVDRIVEILERRAGELSAPPPRRV